MPAYNVLPVSYRKRIPWGNRTCIIALPLCDQLGFDSYRSQHASGRSLEEWIANRRQWHQRLNEACFKPKDLQSRTIYNIDVQSRIIVKLPPCLNMDPSSIAIFPSELDSDISLSTLDTSATPRSNAITASSLHESKSPSPYTKCHSEMFESRLSHNVENKLLVSGVDSEILKSHKSSGAMPMLDLKSERSRVLPSNMETRPSTVYGPSHNAHPSDLNDIAPGVTKVRDSLMPQDLEESPSPSCLSPKNETTTRKRQHNHLQDEISEDMPRHVQKCDANANDKKPNAVIMRGFNVLAPEFHLKPASTSKCQVNNLNYPGSCPPAVYARTVSLADRFSSSQKFNTSLHLQSPAFNSRSSSAGAIAPAHFAFTFTSKASGSRKREAALDTGINLRSLRPSLGHLNPLANPFEPGMIEPEKENNSKQSEQNDLNSNLEHMYVEANKVQTSSGEAKYAAAIKQSLRRHSEHRIVDCPEHPKALPEKGGRQLSATSSTTGNESYRGSISDAKTCSDPASSSRSGSVVRKIRTELVIKSRSSSPSKVSSLRTHSVSSSPSKNAELQAHSVHDSLSPRHLSAANEIMPQPFVDGPANCSKLQSDLHNESGKGQGRHTSSLSDSALLFKVRGIAPVAISRASSICYASGDRAKREQDVSCGTGCNEIRAKGLYKGKTAMSQENSSADRPKQSNTLHLEEIKASRLRSSNVSKCSGALARNNILPNMLEKMDRIDRTTTLILDNIEGPFRHSQNNLQHCDRFSDADDEDDEQSDCWPGKRDVNEIKYNPISKAVHKSCSIPEMVTTRSDETSTNNMIADSSDTAQRETQKQHLEFRSRIQKLMASIENIERDLHQIVSSHGNSSRNFAKSNEENSYTLGQRIISPDMIKELQSQMQESVPQITTERRHAQENTTLFQQASGKCTSLASPRTNSQHVPTKSPDLGVIKGIAQDEGQDRLAIDTLPSIEFAEYIHLKLHSESLQQAYDEKSGKLAAMQSTFAQHQRSHEKSQKDLMYAQNEARVCETRLTGLQSRFDESQVTFATQYKKLRERIDHINEELLQSHELWNKQEEQLHGSIQKLESHLGRESKRLDDAEAQLAILGERECQRPPVLQNSEPGSSKNRDLAPNATKESTGLISALVETIGVLQSQLRDREVRIEELEASDKSKTVVAENLWLWEILNLKNDEIHEIIALIKKPLIDRNSLRQGAVRLQAYMDMIQQSQSHKKDDMVVDQGSMTKRGLSEIAMPNTILPKGGDNSKQKGEEITEDFVSPSTLGFSSHNNFQKANVKISSFGNFSILEPHSTVRDANKLSTDTVDGCDDSSDLTGFCRPEHYESDASEVPTISIHQQNHEF